MPSNLHQYSQGAAMSVWTTLFRLDLGPHHLNPERTKHKLAGQSGSQPFPPFKTLEIGQYEGDTGFYLLYFPESGPSTDTWHLTLDDAMHQAEYEFDVARAEWIAAT
jgi:hypothetical protein